MTRYNECRCLPDIKAIRFVLIMGTGYTLKSKGIFLKLAESDAPLKGNHLMKKYFTD